jgi:ParB family chromosome partitioning protein
MKRKALGKGLKSLIPEAPAKKPAPITNGDSGGSRDLRQIDIDLIRPNPKQPRGEMNEETLETLAASLAERGVLQPVLVRPAAEGRFEIVAGERRWRAAQRAGLLKIPAIVREIPDDRLLETALVENIQREELNPMDEAEAYQVLIDEIGLKQDEVARRVGKQRATVANALRLLSLGPRVQAMVRAGKIGMGHGRALASLENRSLQEDLAKRVAREDLSVRQVENLVARLRKVGEPGRPRSKPKRDPNVVAAEEKLQRALGTKVRIFQGKKGGRMELHFYSTEEMNRVYDLVLGAARQRKP